MLVSTGGGALKVGNAIVDEAELGLVENDPDPESPGLAEKP